MRSLPLRTISSIAVLVCLLPLFQNCSGGFEATGISELSSISSVGPKISVLNAPLALSKSRDLSVQINVSVNQMASVSQVTCILDSNAPVDCKNSFVASGLADGDHSLKIQATDSLNNSSDMFVAVWKIDATVPVVTYSQMPPAVAGSTTVTATFAANEQSTYECQLDTAAFSACVSPLTLTALAQAPHTLKVRAKDLAGNISSDITASFTVDLSAPVLNLVGKPVTPTNATSATFTFNGTDGGAAINVFSCQLDAQAAAACNAGTVTYSNLAAGAHTFKLTGQDSVGNMSAATTYAFTIDLSAPALPVIVANVTSPTKTTSATFQFSSSDASGIKSYNCQLDSNAVEVCAAGIAKTYSSLSSASHTFKVQAVDQAGNNSAFANFTWVVDNALPTITLSQPTTPTTSTSATFAFTAQDAQTSVSVLECQLDAAAFAACTSPRNLTNLPLGSHTFTVRATDAANNQALLATTWTINNVGTPTPTPTVPPVIGKCNGLAAPGQWQEISPPGMKKAPPYTGAIVTLVDPNNGGTLYVTTYESGIFKSSDCGATWKKVNTGRNGDKIDKGRVWSAVIDPVVDPVTLKTTIYALVGYGDPNGLWKSTNDGLDWDNIGPVSPGVPAFVARVSMDPTDHLHLMINFHDNCTAGHNPVCFAETKDGGKNWTILEFPTDRKNSWGEGTAIMPLDATHWLYENSELFYTADAGKTWSQAIAPGGSFGIEGPFYRSPNGSYWLTAGFGGVITSPDGKNWTKIENSGGGMDTITGCGASLFGAKGFQPPQGSEFIFTATFANPTKWSVLPTPGMPTPLVSGATSVECDKYHNILYLSAQGGGQWRMVVPGS